MSGWMHAHIDISSILWKTSWISLACPFKGSKKNIPLIHSRILILPMNLLLLSYHFWPGTLSFIQRKSTFIMGIFFLIVCLGEYPHCSPFIMIPSPNSFPPQIVTCLSLHQPWRERKGREESAWGGSQQGKRLLQEWGTGMKNHRKKKQYLGLKTFSTIYLSRFFLSFSLAISRVYPNAIVIDHPACLVHCHIKQLMTAIPGKSKVTK